MPMAIDGMAFFTDSISAGAGVPGKNCTRPSAKIIMIYGWADSCRIYQHVAVDVLTEVTVSAGFVARYSVAPSRTIIAAPTPA